MFSYMEETAKMLGVKLGEEFKIHTVNDGIIIGKFTKMGFHVKKDNAKLRYDANKLALYELLIGTYTICNCHT